MATRSTYLFCLVSSVLQATACGPQDPASLAEAPGSVSGTSGRGAPPDPPPPRGTRPTPPGSAPPSVPGNPTSDNDPSGVIGTFNTAGPINPDPAANPFFAALGTNGRTCLSCHQQDQGWSITPAKLQEVFNATSGLDPVFRPVDGANSPLADLSTQGARAAAFSLLLQRGVLRVGDGMQVPAGADFALDAVADPHGYATPTRLSLFRRPLPATNARFLSEVMWDGREDQGALAASLQQQASDATRGHAQAAADLTSAQAAAIAAFEEANFTAQRSGLAVGDTSALGATGGPAFLSTQRRQPGPMSLYTAWAGAASPDQQAVARGQGLFNAQLRPGGPGRPPFSCQNCHDGANVGNHAGPGFFVDLGLADAADQGAAGLPVYTVRRLSDGAVRRVTDPGRGLVTGRFADVGSFKVPVLRGLAARAPYFHNGSRTTLLDVVNFYDRRFNLGLSAGQKGDLVAFLQVL